MAFSDATSVAHAVAPLEGGCLPRCTTQLARLAWQRTDTAVETGAEEEKRSSSSSSALSCRVVAANSKLALSFSVSACLPAAVQVTVPSGRASVCAAAPTRAQVIGWPLSVALRGSWASPAAERSSIVTERSPAGTRKPPELTAAATTTDSVSPPPPPSPSLAAADDEDLDFAAAAERV